MSEERKAHCLVCGGERDPDDELGRCQWCGSSAPPCKDEDTVDIRIGWGELTLLFMAAEGRAVDRKNMSAFHAITRLAREVESHWPKQKPLTLKTDQERTRKTPKEIVIPSAEELAHDLLGDQPGGN